MASIPLSWRFPSIDPWRFATKPFGATTDWNFIACTFLCPFYKIFWLSLGLEIGRTVPSTNPQQLLKAAPFWWMVFQNPCKHCGDNHGWFKLLNKWFQFSYIKFVIWLQVIGNWGMGLAKICLISINLHG